MMENLFVSGVLMVSGLFIIQRLRTVIGHGARRESACGSCASGTCSSKSLNPAETELPMAGSL